jgi:hypothetical protein
MLKKEKIDCCLVNYAKQLAINKDYLIKDKELEFNTKLLFLYSFVLEGDCDVPIDSKIIHQINNICGCDICTTCNDNTNIVIEDWIPDESDYETAWRPVCFDCEKDKIARRAIFDCCEQEIAWRPVEFVCESDRTAWRPIYECELVEAWRPIYDCCEQMETKWRPVYDCCQQKTNKKKRKCRKCKKKKCKCK